MTAEEGEIVPSGAISTALLLTEGLAGRADDVGAEDLVKAVDRWGLDELARGFSMLIFTAVSHLAQMPVDEASGPDDGGDRDAGDSEEGLELDEEQRGRRRILELVIPAVVSRFHRMQLAEVPDAALPTVAGLLTAAAFEQEPYAWWIGMTGEPLADDAGGDRAAALGQSLVWCYVAWLVIDFLDAMVDRPGYFAELVSQVLLAGPGED